MSVPDDVPVRIAAAYGDATAAWARGPERIYAALAEALLDGCPIELGGARLLDLGAGTGAVSRAALRRGATVMAVDTSPEMLAHERDTRPPSVVADIRELPFGDASFDVAAAGFSLSHVVDPARALAEARRVVRPDGAVIASVFAAGTTHPSKVQVDAVAARHGYQPPRWYLAFKREIEPLTAEPERLRGVAAVAGLDEVDLISTTVDIGVADPEALVDYRLGMAHLAPFVASLSPAEARRLRDESLAAVGDRPAPLRPSVLILSSRVPA